MFVVTVSLRDMRKAGLTFGAAAFMALVAPQEALAAPAESAVNAEAVAEPILALMKSLINPISRGVYLWSGIKWALGEKAEAKEKFFTMLQARVFILVYDQVFAWLDRLGA
jgi:hypothetical protein